MGIERRTDDGGTEPVRAGHVEQRIGHSSRLATGTLACPACDAPVAPGDRPLAPADALACPYCGRDGAVREFLSLTPPSRPARVVVRVTPPAQRAARA